MLNLKKRIERLEALRVLTSPQEDEGISKRELKELL